MVAFGRTKVMHLVLRPVGTDSKNNHLFAYSNGFNIGGINEVVCGQAVDLFLVVNKK